VGRRRTVIPTFEGNEVRARTRSTAETEVRQCPAPTPMSRLSFAVRTPFDARSVVAYRA
jgi:hypothetical protein